MTGNKPIVVELEPDLYACIKTQAEQEYKRTITLLLNNEEDDALVAKLEILRLFLETTDFQKLRSRYEKHLIAGGKVKFILYLEKGEPRYEMKITA